jgi:hypothetical protein
VIFPRLGVVLSPILQPERIKAVMLHIRTCAIGADKKYKRKGLQDESHLGSAFRPGQRGPQWEEGKSRGLRMNV